MSKYLLSFSGAIVALAGNFTRQTLVKIERDVHRRGHRCNPKLNRKKPNLSFLCLSRRSFGEGGFLPICTSTFQRFNAALQLPRNLKSDFGQYIGEWPEMSSQ